MGKDKKKHSKKDKVSDDLLDVAAVSLKKFRKVTKEISKLSTGQKLVGGIALAAAGLAYLAAQETDESSAKDPAPDDDAPASEAPAPRRTRKLHKHQSE